MKEGTVIWITGRPASGKSTLAENLNKALRARGDAVLRLDSDDLRRVLTPHPTYAEDERELFYGIVIHFAQLAARGGITVLISATGIRRAWRDTLRNQVPRFVEVQLECGLREAERRDPKALYFRARQGQISNLPGWDVTCEHNPDAELVLNTERMDPKELTDAVMRWLDGHEVPAPA